MAGRLKRAGFSLIEVLVVVAVFALLSSLVASIFSESLRTYRAGDVSGLVQSDLRFALNYMSVHLREATHIDSFSGEVDDITFTFLDSSGPEDMQFFYDQQQIMRKKGTEAPQPICSFVSSLSFELVDRELTITITSVSSVPGSMSAGSALPITLKTVVFLRNR